MTLRRIRTRLFHWWFVLSRPMTLGVRIIVRDKKGRVLLVRHTYVEGWHLPGGGVETGQTAEDAARRELLEEAMIEVNGELRLLSVHANRHASRRDHVLVYECPDWQQKGEFVPNGEIAEIGFFAPEELPQATTGPTRDRLREAFEGHPRLATW